MSGSNPHCKDPAHLKVVVTNERPTLHATTVTYMVDAQCENVPGGYHSWALVLSDHKAALNGLHLLPEAVAWLPGQLRAVALMCSNAQVVTLQHTSLKDFIDFASWSPVAARAVAADIESKASQAPH